MYVYKFVDYTDTIIYIGKTENIDRRMKQHFNGKGHLDKECYDSVCEIYYIKLDGKTNMDIYETYLINKYRPKYNKEKQFNENLDNNDTNDFIKLQEVEWTRLFFRYSYKGIEISNKPYVCDYFDRGLFPSQQGQALVVQNYYLLDKQLGVIKKYMPNVINNKPNVINTLKELNKWYKINGGINNEFSCYDEPLDIIQNQDYQWAAIPIKDLSKYPIQDILTLIHIKLLIRLDYDICGLVGLTPYTMKCANMSYNDFVL